MVAEAANHLPKDLLEQFPEVPWRDLINMGHRLRHQYFRVESDIAWDTVALHFPRLQVAVERMFEADFHAEAVP